MTLAATFLGGAKTRLLPPSIPFRYFGAAIVFHVAGWLALLVASSDVPDFSGGPGWPLAALHLLTLGVLAMTAAGAAFQLLPVATRQPLPTLWPTKAVFWFLAPGTAALAYGMATGTHLPMAIGGGLAVVALVGFALILADNLRRAKDLPLVAAFGWLAILSLVGLSLVGFALIADFEHGFMSDHAAIAHVHVIVAGYGFMGMLALGFSHVLIPMFTLSPAPDRRLGRTSLILAAIALALAVAGKIIGQGPVTVAGALVGLAAAATHLMLMAGVLKSRMRKRLGLSFALVCTGWALLPVGLVVGVLDLLGLAGPRGGTLFGFLLIFGWLLTFLTGILQRIIPFLGSMHAARTGGKPPLVSALTPEGPLTAHTYLHLAALAFLACGIALDNVWLVRAGAVLGSIGALAFALFALIVIGRLRHSDSPND